MQKHDFEKQVQEKLEELSLTPSAPVWQKVEEQIRKKKDKRRIIFWMLPLLLTGMGIAGYWLFHPVQTVTRKNEVAVNRAEQRSSSAAASHPNTAEHKTQKENSSKPSIDKTIIITQKPVISHPSSYYNSTSIPSIFAKKNNKDILSVQEINNTSSEAEATNIVSVMITINEPVDVIPISINKDSLLLLKPVTTIKTAINNAIVASDHYKEKKWQWSAFTYFGSSNVQNGLADALNLDKSYSLYAAPAPNSSGTGYSLPPSPTTKGWAIAAGVDVKRKISNRTFLTSGVHYAYYSTHIYVGQKIPDSSNIGQNLYDASSNFSNTNRTYNYQNRYYFIEVPISVDYQLLKQKPLYVHTGFSVAQLIKSHALYYNPSSNLYYQTNRYLNKTQINWQAGITYQFSITKHFLVEAGPQIQYGLRPLQQQYDQEKLHLFSSGMRLNFSLK